MSAIVAVLALLVAVPFDRPDVCRLCPSDCPMHARAHDGRPTTSAHHLGCHHAETPDAETGSGDRGGCAMRAGCGHHEAGTVVVFHAVLSSVVVGHADVITPVRDVLASPKLPLAPEPPVDPPRAPTV